MKTIEKSILVGFILSLIFSITSFANGCDSISTKVLRLHILANSDSEEDQLLKMKIRDKIIEKSGDFLNGISDKIVAQQTAQDNLDKIQKIAEEEIIKQGFNYPVKVEITDMYFPTRQYDTITLPAGRYDAVRVLIGSGKGKNWWCVIFPQLCLGSSLDNETTETILTGNENDIINSSDQFEVKFKIVEWYYLIKEGVENWLNSHYI